MPVDLGDALKVPSHDIDCEVLVHTLQSTQMFHSNIVRPCSTYPEEAVKEKVGVEHPPSLSAGTQHRQHVRPPEQSVGAVDLRDVAKQPRLVCFRQDIGPLQVRQARQEQLCNNYSLHKSQSK